MRIVLLLICGIVPTICNNKLPCRMERAKEQFENALYDFSLDLLTKTVEAKENHVVISPLSIWTLLSCVSLGAKESTLKELKKVLNLHKRRCYNKKYLAIAGKIANNDTDVVVEKTSSIFLNNKFQVKEEFISKVKDCVNSFENLSFEDPNAAAERINEFVSNATHDRIKEIISPDAIDLTTAMVMVDTVYFKGDWDIPFESYYTMNSKFFNEEGEPIGNVSSMFTYRELNCAHISFLEAKVLELQYGNETERYSMYIFLPDKSLHNVIDKLKRTNLLTIRYYLQFSGKVMAVVRLPRFKITSDIDNLKDLLSGMGLKAMFDDKKAKFPIISDKPIYVSNVIHKAEIEVTEKGTVATAATELEFTDRAGRPEPFQFFANKPFLFMIVDKEYNIPIFTGTYSKPTVY